jgi:hypothetical protein
LKKRAFMKASLLLKRILIKSSYVWRCPLPNPSIL